LLHNGFQAAVEDASDQQHAAATSAAAQADVCTDANHRPVIAATRVWLPQPYQIADVNIGVWALHHPLHHLFS
jgi:hypothetical protein